MDGGFVPWLVELRAQVLEKFPLRHGLEALPADELLPPKWILQLKPNANGQSNGISGPKNTSSSSLEVTLTDTQRLTPPNHWQDVRQMSFVSLANEVYDPGDVLTIYPHNAYDDVQCIIDLMHWSDVAEEQVALLPTKSEEVSQKNKRSPIKTLAVSTMTFRQLLTSHLDLNAIPRRSFFSIISHFTEDEFQKERLQEFAKPDYTDELFDYTTRPRRSTLEVLQEFDTVKIPWEWVTNFLPALRGRQFSIASGGVLRHEGDQARFDLLVAIVKYRTVIKKLREGVCTKYLTSLHMGQSLSVSLQKGSLGLSKTDLSRPMVLIGPGTGVAPIRSILWQRTQWAKEAQGTIGEHILVYGCRNEDADYFYRAEWELLQDQIPLQVHAAFSRDQHNKIYVQDIIKQQGRTIHRLLHDLEGTVFVCGSSGKMPTAVRAALAAVFRDCGSISQSEAESYLETMERKGRYKQETWG